jgi:hypothetical protein
MGPVTHRMLPLTVVRPAASRAPQRSVNSLAARYTASVTTTPDATPRRRGPSSVCSPTRSASQTSGRNTGPWLENTSRNGTPPWRMAIAEAPYTPSSNVR